MLRPVSQQSPQGCHRNSAMFEHRSLSDLEVGMSGNVDRETPDRQTDRDWDDNGAAPPCCERTDRS